jgi:lipopolysaccharide/colanic/teichoic acid biosynthesis glycosyltransferase
MLKRLTDIIFSLVGLILLSPLLLLIAAYVAVDSRGPVLYRQKRIGLRGKEFTLLKFRTMRVNSDRAGLLTVGGKDPRITRAGILLRKYKIDELPQLFNVLGGSMSLVGPRPEVKKYVDLYSPSQREVLSVKPGITDYASLIYFEENELLAKSDQPELTYINEIMPAKLELNRKYIAEKSFVTDMKIIGSTVRRIFKRS